LLLAPALLTLLSVLERMTGVYGPNPIVWRGALPGAALCIAGAVLCSMSGAPASSPVTRRRWGLNTARWAAGSALLIGIVGLASPALQATSVGVLPRPFEVTWAMRGFEVAASWLPVAAALVVLSAALLAPGRVSRAALVVAGITALIAAFAYPFLLDTPLHTWNNWIPSDVQQTYGTEYARFSVKAIMNPAAVAATVASAVAACALMVSALWIAPPEDL